MKTRLMMLVLLFCLILASLGFAASNPYELTLKKTFNPPEVASPSVQYLDGNYLYVINNNESLLVIIDVSDPLNPQLVSTISTDISPIGLTVQGDYAYVVNYSPAAAMQFQIFDVSDKQNPSLVGWSMDYPDGLRALRVDGNYAYLVDNENGSLGVYNISDKTAPFRAGSVSLGGHGTYPTGIFKAGNDVFVYYGDGPHVGGVADVNVVDPANPNVAGYLSSIGHGFLVNNVFYVGNSGNVQAVDMSLPGTKYIWFANQSLKKIELVDVTDLNNQFVVDSAATSSGPGGVSLFGEYAFVNNYSDNSIQVFDTLAPQIVRYGGVIVVHQDCTSTEYAAASDTNLARGTALMNAVNADANGDVLYLTAGDFNMANHYVDLSKAGTITTSIHGAGQNQTTIRKTYGSGASASDFIIPADGSQITDLTLTVNDYNHYEYALGMHENGMSWSIKNSWVKNVTINGYTSGIYFGAGSTGTQTTNMNVINTTINTYGQDYFLNQANSTINIYDSNFNAFYNPVKHSSGLSGLNTEGIAPDYGTTNVFNTKISVGNALLNGGVVLIGNGTIVSLYANTVIRSSGTNPSDLENSNDGVINVSPSTDYNVNRTSGNITQVGEVPEVVPSLPAEKCGAPPLFDGGAGTTDDPYQISTCEQLQGMDLGLDGNYVLINDINCSGTRAWNGGAGFVPVGSVAAPFTGTLDGNHHSITGLYINRPSSDYTGLFGYTNAGIVIDYDAHSSTSFTVIKDINVVDANVAGQDYVGVLAGYYGGLGDGMMTNAYSSGEVSGRDYVGGLVGYFAMTTGDIGAEFSDIKNSGSHSAVHGRDNVGGLLGHVFTPIINDYADGNVSGRTNVGGLIGIKDEGAPLWDSYAGGSVTGDSYVGGLVGAGHGDTFLCYTTGDVNGDSNVGGVLGYIDNSVAWQIYATGKVTGITNVGGLIGAQYQSNDLNSFATGKVFGTTAVGGLTGTDLNSQSPSDDFVNSYWYDNPDDNATSCFLEGNNNCTKITDANGGKAYFFDITKNLFLGWDFSVWSSFCNGHGYPSLNWQGISSIFACPGFEDLVAPVTSILGNSVGAWTTSDQTISLNCSDVNGLGCSAIGYRIDSGTWQVYSFPFTLSTDGNHQIDFNSTDAAGNIEATRTVYAAIDKTPPTVLSVDNNGIWMNTDFNIVASGVNFDVSGKQAAQYHIDGGEWSNFTTDYNVSITTEGNHTIDFNFTDNAGNSTVVAGVHALLDKTPPTVTPSGNSYSTWGRIAQTVTLSCSDTNSGCASIRYSLDGGAYQNYSSPFLIGYDGNHSIAFDANDAAGNRSASQTTYSAFDTASPLTSISGNAAGWSGADENLTLSCYDSNSGCASTGYRVDSGSWVAYSAPFTLSTDGNHRIDFNSTDFAGNIEGTKTIYVAIDKTAPITTPSGNSADWTDANQLITLACADANSGCSLTTYSIGGGAWQEYSSPFVISTDGNHQIDYNSSDAAGNAEGVKTIFAAVDKSAPTYSAMDGNGLPWKSADFNISVSGADFSVSGEQSFQYRIDFGSWQDVPSDAKIPITTDGDHQVDVNLMDNAGNTTLLFLLALKDSEAPVYGSSSGLDRNWQSTDFNVWFNDINYGVSGKQLAEYYIDGAGPFDFNYNVGDTNYGIPITVDGNHLVQAVFRDNADNDLNVGGYAALDTAVLTVGLAETHTSSSVSLTATLDKNGYCRYAVDSNADYNAMNSSTTSALSATANWSITGLSSGTTYTFYVQCIGENTGEASASLALTTDSSGSGSPSGGGSYTGPVAPSNPASTTLLSESSEDFSPSAGDINEVLGGLVDANNQPLFTPAQIALMIADTNGFSFTKTIKVEQVVDAQGNTSFMTTFTILVKNNGSSDASDVAIVEIIPKAVAPSVTAGQINSTLGFKLLSADPVIQFVVPLIRAGGNYSIVYDLNTAIKPDANAYNFSSPLVSQETIAKPVVSSVTNPPVPPAGNEGISPPPANPPATLDMTPVIAIILVVIFVIIGIVAFAQVMGGKSEGL